MLVKGELRLEYLSDQERQQKLGHADADLVTDLQRVEQALHAELVLVGNALRLGTSVYFELKNFGAHERVAVPVRKVGFNAGIGARRGALEIDSETLFLGQAQVRFAIQQVNAVLGAHIHVLDGDVAETAQAR